MRGISFAALALLVAVPVHAQEPARPQRPDQVAENDPLQMSPNRAYIFFRSQERLPYRFLREVTATERAAHAARRARALGAARTRYERRLREWQGQQRSCRGNPSLECQNGREQPVEPTDATFSFAPPETDNFIDVATRPRFTHLDDWSGYLIAVEPGTYTLYGQMAPVAQAGVINTCYCMGSVRFEARGGQITYVGEVTPPVTRAAARAVLSDDDPDDFTLTPGLVVAPHTAAMAMPERFAGLPVVPAELRAADKMPNYFGALVNRVAAISGVLDYRRDVVVDARTGTPLGEGTR